MVWTKAFEEPPLPPSLPCAAFSWRGSPGGPASWSVRGGGPAPLELPTTQGPPGSIINSFPMK